MKYRLKSTSVDAVQFKNPGSGDEPETTELARSLGLSRNGTSLLWEIKTSYGWRIVYHNHWIVTSDGSFGSKQVTVYNPEDFEELYELVSN